MKNNFFMISPLLRWCCVLFWGFSLEIKEMIFKNNLSNANLNVTDIRILKYLCLTIDGVIFIIENRQM
jgi:hypothetical protein